VARVDEAATTELRAAKRTQMPVTTATPGAAGRATDGARFDFGPARREHERRWPPELQDALIARLMRLPAPYRAYARRTLHARAAALAPDRSLTADDLDRLWQELPPAIARP
jgi:hypothetical protein